MIGKIIHQTYKIIDFLGGGGFGRAYLAKNLSSSDNIWYVVKQLQPSISPLNTITWDKAKELFYQEAEMLKFLGNHSRIPQLFNFFEEDGKLFIVEEFIEGYELTEEFNYTVLNELHVYQLLLDILEILEFIQNNNVIHRDISPDNLIKRRNDGKLVLIDFGAVKQVLLDNDGKHRRSKTIAIGKEGYMPDEQANGRPGFYSDVYAVGVIGIQACIGDIPSKDYDSGEIIWRHQSSIQNELAEILDKMTRCFHKERYQSASEALKDLRSLSSNYSDINNIRVNKFKYNYTKYWYICANKLKDNKYREEAILLYRKVLEVNPNHFDANFNIGITRIYLKQYNLALETYNYLLNIKPNSLSTLLHKSIVLFKLMRYDETLNYLESIIRTQPHHSVAWFYKTLTLQKLKREQEAIIAYQETLRLRPSYVKYITL